ncbi:MAG: hypothetical protein ACK4ND_10090 [Cytophagaceae bacterium]
MEIYFEEKQFFRNRWVMGLLVFLLLIVLLGIYQQVFLGEPFGTSPVSDTLLVVFSLVPVSLLVFMYIMCMKIVVDKMGIHFKIFPLNRDYHLYTWNDIDKIEIRKYKPVQEYGGWGIRWWFGKRAYTMSGNIGLKVNLKNGKEIMFGTNKAGELEEVLEKLKSKNLVTLRME